jgi:DNA-binding NarL/FixJ family response regulator
VWASILSLMDKIRILLADDHINVRNQVRVRLSRECDLEVVGEASSSAQTIEYALVSRPHVILIDPMLRDGLGLKALRQITGYLPQTAIVVLTAFADTALQIDLRKIGVHCILTKGVNSQELLDTLRAVVYTREQQPDPDTSADQA